MLWDYLFSDVYFASRTKIDFPAEFSEGYAYCRSLIYGAQPGKFYDEQGITPYMPKGMISLSDIQANYLAGYGNGKLCVAVVNQSPTPRCVTLRFDPARQRTRRIYYAQERGTAPFPIRKGNYGHSHRACGCPAPVPAEVQSPHLRMGPELHLCRF